MISHPYEMILGGGRCNVMHNPMKGATEIAKVSRLQLSHSFMIAYTWHISRTSWHYY